MLPSLCPWRSVTPARLAPEWQGLGMWAGGMSHSHAEATALNAEDMHALDVLPPSRPPCPRLSPVPRPDLNLGLKPWAFSRRPCRRWRCSCSAALASTRLMRTREHHFVSGQGLLQPHSLPLFPQVLGSTRALMLYTVPGCCGMCGGPKSSTDMAEKLRASLPLGLQEGSAPSLRA